MTESERAVSSPLEYALTIGIASILVIGLVTAMTGFIDGQREKNAEAQMDIVGQQVAGSLEATDRLARSTDSPPNKLVLERELPDQILGSNYFVKITSSEVRVTSPLTDDTVTVDHTVDDPPAGPSVLGAEIEGGQYQIEFLPGPPPEIEVTQP